MTIEELDSDTRKAIEELLEYQGVPAINTDDIDIGSADLVSSGNFLGVGPSLPHYGQELSTTNTNWTSDETFHQYRVIWDNWAPSDAQTAVSYVYRTLTSVGDIRLRNVTDSENVFKDLDVSSGTINSNVINYTPTTTSSSILLRLEIQTNDGGTSTAIREADARLGVQL
jgi:hypothetical protein